ncbi:hypothetical protein C8R43DRAFT_1020931 [Mycena crocata]|nr:hypothetical protein C8R43DRAFT_1020931 [Mycena crocata]
MSLIVRAVYFPLQGEEVTRLALEYSPQSPIVASVKQALSARGLRFAEPLAYFKLEGFLRDPQSSIGQRISANFSDLVENTRIEEDDLVSSIWPNGPDLTTPAKIDLLIVSEQVVTKRAAIAHLPTGLRPRHAGAFARQNLATTVETLPTPSTCSSNPKQLYEHAGTLAGRPFGRCGPPTCLFDSHLAGLADALRDLGSAVPLPSPSKITWGLSFFKVAVGFHSNEAEMEKVLRPLLDELFADGTWQQSIDGGRREAHGPGWIYELKKQKGLGGDPEAQAVADCEKLLCDKTTSHGKMRDRSRLPTILVSQAGPQLDIAVAICAEVVLVDQLFSINLRDGINVDEQILTLARLATCLSNTSTDLGRYYNNLSLAPVSPTIASGLHLPAPVSASAPHSLISDALGLSFLYKLSRVTGKPVNVDDEIDRNANARHTVFVALGRGNAGIPSEEVIVKFTKQYNEIAHTMLHALGLAPRLYHHAAIRGGLYMTVMEKVVGVTAFRWQSTNNATHLPSSVLTDVDTAIKTLHSADLVFGDLRLPNIMIRGGEQDSNGDGGQDDGGSEWCSADAGRTCEAAAEGSNIGEHDEKLTDNNSGGALLIDFDWTGQDGVARYPITISTLDEWAPDVKPYGLMSKAHDLYCLNYLRQKCNNN